MFVTNTELKIIADGFVGRRERPQITAVEYMYSCPFLFGILMPMKVPEIHPKMKIHSQYVKSPAISLAVQNHELGYGFLFDMKNYGISFRLYE